MKNTTTTLKNPYYFIEDDASGNKCLYNIATKQDEDGCGVHLVTYITEEQNLEKGDSYRDLHGNVATANRNGAFDVSTGEVDPVESGKVFPFIKITYKETADAAKTKDKYLWLTEFIEVGDVFVNNKFVVNPKHTPADGGSYVSVYQEQLGETIAGLIASDYSLDYIKTALPEYVFAQPNDEITIDGKKVYLVSVTTSESESGASGNEMNVNEDEILDYFYAYCNDLVVTYANRLLKKFDKKLVETDGEKPVLISDENVTGLYPNDDTYWKITVPSRLTGGTISVRGCDDYSHVLDGTHITLIAAPAKNYGIGTFTINGRDITSPYEFDIHEDVVIALTFVSQIHIPTDDPDPTIIQPEVGEYGDPQQPSGPIDDGNEEDMGEGRN